MHISWGTTTSWEPTSLSMTLCVMKKAVNNSSDWFRYKVESTLLREIDRLRLVIRRKNRTSWVKRPDVVQKLGKVDATAGNVRHLTTAQNYEVRPKIALILL
ncbi:hypothetical protein AVEN_176328-1 [Araneus ventricosus]|uniref:Uncharacterized protein n=1 Tax=Araneus ventricosus TaxID=182803 RepID=A0A4Y2RT75_ARAVE|nr:hypothetical protein AVEN_176328-1 [Araneus ventricosus]